MKLKVTILVPVYGVEKYIEECARSLFEQTYQDIEYIFCNDCTPDGSIQVLERVMEDYPERSKHTRIIHNERNLGLGGTRQRLLETVQTEAFLCVDSDDKLPANAIQLMAERMMETGCDIVDGKLCQYKGSETVATMLPRHCSDAKYQRLVLCQNVVDNRVAGRLMRTSLREKVKPLFFEGINYAEDYCATSRLSAVASRSWTDELVYLYRRDVEESYTNNVGEKQIMQCFKANAEVLRFYHLRGHLSLALEIGLLNCYRDCHKYGIELAKCDEILRYVPQHFTAQLLSMLLRGKGVKYRVGDIIYKVLRRLMTI